MGSDRIYRSSRERATPSHTSAGAITTTGPQSLRPPQTHGFTADHVVSAE